MSRLHRTVRRHGLAWLYVLALLLPLAQSAAAWHAAGHLAADARARDDGSAQSAHAASCELCLVATAAGGGALPSALPVIAPAPFGHAHPQAHVPTPRAADRIAAYRSRAPPVFLH